MTRKKLFLTAVTLLLAVFGGGGKISAQASYNHTYTIGTEVAAGSDYFLYNIGAKQFLTNGLDYGTRATVDNSGRVLTLATNTNGYSIYTNYVSLNERSEAKAGFLTTNGYVDTGTNDADWVFTPVDVAGYTNAYTIKNSDTQYLFFDQNNTNPGCPVNVGNNTGNDYSYWLLISKATREAMGDYSHYLINTQMNAAWEFKTWSGSTAWDDVSIIQPGGLNSNRCGEKFHTIVDICQNVKETLPNGRYKFYGQSFWRQDGSAEGPVLYANSDTKTILSLTGTENSMNDASSSFTAGKYVNSVETFVNDGKLKVGINIRDGNQWVIFDNFVLDYLGQCVMDYAVKLPDGGNMEADTWYYFDIATAADNYTATATTLGDIICTTDGYTQTSSTTSTVTLTAENNNLLAQRYYVKSSSANNLIVGVAAYSYSISEATADLTYIQPGNTVTVNYTVNTNDPEGALTQDYSGVTFAGNAITVTPTASGFTFTVPTVATNNNYVLAIPAGAIKYNNDNQNAVQNITLKTPVLFDGTYYLRVEATYNGTIESTSNAVGKYMARGTAYSTHLSIDNYGLPVVVTTDGSNRTTLKMADTNGYVFSNGDYDAFADGGSPTYFTISIQNSKFLIASNNRGGKYLKYNTSAVDDEEISVFDDGNGTNSGPIIMWNIESISEHATAMQIKKNNQAATAAAAAYASGNYNSLNGITTVSALETELTANYIEGEFVSPSTITSVLESYQPRNNTFANLEPVMVYSNTINITKPGFYKFSMQAFNRATWNNDVQALHEAGADMPAAALFFGDSETQIKSLYDESGEATATTTEGNTADVLYNGTYYANGTDAALVMFKNNKYHNDVWFYAPAAGTYTYGVKVMGYAAGQWFIYSPESVTITSYAAAADATDYTNLNAAIETAEGKILGFEEGEYAPYNNVDAITAITTAKGIDQNATNSKLLVQSTIDALSNWIINATDVDAFYDGGFSQIAIGNVSTTGVKGWTTGDANNMRQIVSAEKFANEKALYIWPTTVNYGETTGYTMPLKANTWYKFTYSYGGWNDNMDSPTISILNSNGEGLTSTETGSAPKYDTDVKTYVITFQTGAAGNYIFSYAAPNGTNTTIGDFSLTKCENVNLNMNITAAEWATFIAPFEVTIPNGVKAYTVEGIEGETLQKTELATTIPANTPVLLNGPADTYPVSGVNIATEDSYTEGILVGVYKDQAVTSNGANDVYVLQKQDDGLGFYKASTVAAEAPTVKANRAYIKLASGGGIKALFFDDDEATAIESVDVQTAGEYDAIYTATGVKVNSLQKGLNIVVKNGKSYKIFVK